MRINIALVLVLCLASVALAQEATKPVAVTVVVSLTAQQVAAIEASHPGYTAQQILTMRCQGQAEGLANGCINEQVRAAMEAEAKDAEQPIAAAVAAKLAAVKAAAAQPVEAIKVEESTEK